MKTIELIVYGIPVPQGSSRAFVIPGKNGAKPRAIVTDANVKTKPWKQEISGAADEHMHKLGLPVAEGLPVAIFCRFFFDKPKSVKKAITCKITKPDLDKLIRSVLDALTGTVFKDDAQVVHLAISKDFDSRPRAEIKIEIYQHHEFLFAPLQDHR